ncbi:MAG: PHB depolymerase family esterase [Caulobacteraceae bacterium]
MFSHEPPGLPSGAPLVVVLHGCGQRAEDYAACAGWLTLADRFGFAVLAPEQTSANNPNGCFNWFSAHDTRRGLGEAGSIAGMVASMVRTAKSDPGRVFVTGLSAGGAMTMAMLASYPDIFAGGAVIAGLPFGVAGDVGQAFAAMHGAGFRSGADLAALLPVNAHGSYPRLTIWHGDADHVVSPANAPAIARQWAVAQGLPEAPDDTKTGAGRSRSVWRDPRGGIAIELHGLKGLGHGVPLATTGPAGLGKAAPFMLETGVSSSREIAEFWGITGVAAVDRPPVIEGLARLASPPTPPPTYGGSPAATGGAGMAEGVLASLAERVPPGVHAVIDKALRSAGLLK